MQNFKKTSVCLYLLSSWAFTSLAAQAAGKNDQDYFSDNNKYIYSDLTTKHFVLQGLPDDGAVVEAYQYDDLGNPLAIPFFKKVLKNSDNGGEISRPSISRFRRWACIKSTSSTATIKSSTNVTSHSFRPSDRSTMRWA
ncbi:hypothetical protein [Lonsdalea iberica]|uniref:Uncharacterized protein n=1 Tax=Lonsdalea iberica TaxID=1082703 RepID=A0A1X3S1N7_9GAMM|nr:hypothetical protein [Lonsdalea iberica]OSN08451.1 hypothetical protein AU511_00945 [Lonsdalea iberica]